MASSTVQLLRSPQTIRERCHHILEKGLRDELTHFSVHKDKLADVAEFVLKVTKDNYPDLQVPYHSRWQHFVTQENDYCAPIKNELASMPQEDQGKAWYDLVIISVLLDAGAGMAWRYKINGETLSKSEGLAIASLKMFEAGIFSSTSRLSVEADKLLSLTEDDLKRGFQVSDDNPLIGVAGRLQLMNRLGQVLKENPEVFGAEGRLGNLFSYLSKQASDSQLDANNILQTVLQALGGIWPGRIEIDGVNLGDVWHHSAAKDFPSAPGLVPFHKLSQWLTYSLVEPLEWQGITVSRLNELTGLPEYRNGGLLLDMGLLGLKDPEASKQAHKPDSELIVEWRALTVALLDKIGDSVREMVQKSPEEFPLAKVLQGGTWAAGRILAKDLRADGGPPLNLDSDGTVF